MTDTATTSTPPWGDDFDAEKAWTLVQNLRGDKEKLQGEKDSLTAELATERQAREDAEKAAKDTDPDGKLSAAEKRAADAERSLWTERALRKHEIDEELVEFLAGDTEEAILAKAEKLSKVGKPGSEKPKGDEGKDGEKPSGDSAPPEGDLQSRPAPTLTPGHGGDTPAPFDPEAIASAARKARA
jgi:hypothetical protein